MTRADFLFELHRRLKKLPLSEVEEAMSYYEEYFEEAGPAGEQELIFRLGSPAQVASVIIGEYATKMIYEQDAQKRNSSLKTLWIVILAVLASPIAIPLAASIIVLAASILLSLFATYLALFVTAVALMATGLLALGLSVPTLFSEPIYTVDLLGYSLICLSVGLALFLGTTKLSQLTIRGITWLFAWLLKMRGVRQ
jgi:uncharacterized membrane protein